MKRLAIGFDEERLEDIRELARRKRASMSGLVRYALDKAFEDELDVIAGERSLEEALRDPSSTMSLDEYVQQRMLRQGRAATGHC